MGSLRPKFVHHSPSFFWQKKIKKLKTKIFNWISFKQNQKQNISSIFYICLGMGLISFLTSVKIVIQVFYKN